MVFSSLFFLFLFLPLNLIIYNLVTSLKAKNLILIIFSLIFYAWGEPIWISLLIFSATIDYFNGKIIEKNRGNFKAKSTLAFSIFINISLLVFFKYYGFVVESINQTLNLTLTYKEFGLPIGISFYTFQTLSYTIDVYRGKVSSQKSYLKFLMFVSLFHQLVAGPIVRYKDIAKEIEYRTVSLSRFNKGILRFINGLGKKVIIANTAGNLAGFFLDGNIENLSVLGSWYGISLFAVQIYFDFSGYSDMAIGLGHMCGFTYRENFNYPYIAKSATDFWRRWHISLGSFFRDYVYIPLGGNKKRHILNLSIVWFLTGLWHGASWNFVLWGLYFGFFIAAEKIFLLKLFAKIPKFFSHLYLILIVLVGWVLFYFENLSQGLKYMGIMFGVSGAQLYSSDIYIRFMNNIYFYILALILSTPIIKIIIMKLKNEFNLNTNKYKPSENILQGVYIVLILIISSSLLVGQSYNPFLYFRF